MVGKTRIPNNKTVSDRSGFQHRASEMVKEPGTDFWVHKSESDGMWNLFDHPQNHLSKYATLSGDPVPVKNVRMEVDTTVTQEQLDAHPILDVQGNRIL